MTAAAETRLEAELKYRAELAKEYAENAAKAAKDAESRASLAVTNREKLNANKAKRETARAILMEHIDAAKLAGVTLRPSVLREVFLSLMPATNGDHFTIHRTVEEVTFVRKGESGGNQSWFFSIREDGDAPRKGKPGSLEDKPEILD